MRNFFFLLTFLILCTRAARGKDCSSPKIYSLTENACVCPNKCTAFNTWQYSGNCKCYCDEIFDCPELKRFSWSRCDCKCNKTLRCSSPQYFDESTCTCECPSSIQCPGNQVPLKPNCTCGCPMVQPVCPENKHWDPISCSCVCTKCEGCKANQHYDYENCGCVCNMEVPSKLPAYKYFNEDLCEVLCKQNGTECNQRAPSFGWNSELCQCDFCPENQLRKELCESQPKYSWNASNCSCSFCPLRSQGIIDCANQGSPFAWSETACECVFCLNRNAIQANCSSAGVNYSWNDAACSCTYTPPTSGGGSGSNSTGGGQAVIDPFNMDFGSGLAVLIDALTGMFNEVTSNITVNDVLAMIFNTTSD